MKGIAMRIFSIYKPFRRAVIGMFGFLAAMQALTLVSPFLYGKIIDAVISKTEIGQVMMFAAMSFVVYIVQTAISYFQNNFEIDHFDFEVARHVSSKTLRKVLSFSVGQHNNQHSGVKQNIINRGEHSLRSFAYTMLYDVLPLGLRVIFTTAALLYLNVLLGSIVLVSIVLFVGITFFINTRMRNDLKTHQDMIHEEEKIHSEIIRHVETVQVHAQEKKVTMEYDDKFKEVGDFGMKMWKRYGFVAALRSLIIDATKFLVIAVGAYLIYRKQYTPGYFVVFMTWSSNVLNQLGNVGSLHRRCMEMIVAIKKYFAMMDVEPDIKVIPNPVKTERFSGRIEFKNVSFKYPVRSYLEDDKIASDKVNNQEAISNLSFVIEPGQRVAFVGHSGAGKSTLAHLITRSYDPDKGQVIIDGNDLRVLDLKNYREAMGVVEQDVKLFDQTLRYNITFGLNGRGALVTDKDLHVVAKSSRIDKFFDRLENGFDTIIGEKGIKLSGGERQRVGIARALIKDPQILLFDEATSNLDTENETSIRESIRRASEGRTTIIIAHRLSTIKDADKIFVFEKSRLVGEGTHDQLVENCDEYRKLINSQVVTV